MNGGTPPEDQSISNNGWMKVSEFNPFYTVCLNKHDDQGNIQRLPLKF